MISSTLLALNLQRNFEEITNAEYCIVCIVQDFATGTFLSALEDHLTFRNLGRVLPIIETKDELAFSVILEEPIEGVKVVKRSLWESGVLLSTRIVLIRPEIKMFKDFGVGE